METFIKNFLKRNLKEEMIYKLMDTSFDRFKAAFTTKNVKELENYEYFEQLGDLSINKFIVTYMSNRFPQLRSSIGVSVLANLRILYASKDILSKLSEKYGFDKYIMCTQEERLDKLKFRDILEDVFESFIGAIEYSIDKEYFFGLGYISIFKLLEGIFDEIDIKIDYKSLVDAKTRLNELRDEYKINLKYVESKKAENGMFLVNLYNDINLIGTGTSNIKKNAQIEAARQGLEWIKENLNIEKETPLRFRIMSDYTW